MAYKPYDEVQFGKSVKKLKPTTPLENDLVDILRKNQNVGYLKRARSIIEYFEKRDQES